MKTMGQGRLTSALSTRSIVEKPLQTLTATIALLGPGRNCEEYLQSTCKAIVKVVIIELVTGHFVLARWHVQHSIDWIPIKKRVK